MQVLLVDPSCEHLPDGVADLLTESGWQVQAADDYRSAVERAHSGQVDAIVLPMHVRGRPPGADRELVGLLREIDSRRIAAILIGDGPAESLLQEASLIDFASTGVSKEEIRARLTTLTRYQALVRSMESELTNMERLGKRLNQHFAQVDQEMQLASRLQRDFLPHVDEPIGPLRFAVVYRPASWVSGDIYDVFRVDEQHVAFYVADAVGHGMAASLLTMFIKKAVTGKRVRADGYELLDPSQSLSLLNDALAAQSLPNCQFVTACYCLVNTETLELQYARGGHTYPLFVSVEGRVTELKSTGGLLGLFPGEEFITKSIRLKPGEKIILYSDGLEFAYKPREEGADKWSYHRRVFESLAHLPVTRIASDISTRLDQEAGSLNPHDDVTVVAMEVMDNAPTEVSASGASMKVPAADA
ncbi:MAG TPA: SpoIIE family protein phosphatase [Phycisphaerae bacterium]|nr:SpoIIE family protein phosphatase [Phycisphaerae bacterium]